MVLGTYCKSPCAGVPNILLISPILPCVTPALPPDSAWINEIIFFKSLPFRVTPILLAARLMSPAHAEAFLFLLLPFNDFNHLYGLTAVSLDGYPFIR